jgi:hypothetical protein
MVDAMNSPAARPSISGSVIAVLFFLALHAALAWQSRAIGVLTGQDDVEYLVLAESLRQGTYRETFRVGTPFHYQYPPAYPAMLAVWGMLLGTHFDTLVALSIALSTCALGVLFLVLRRIFDARFGALCIGVLAVNPELVQAAGAIMSEPAYLCVSLLALYLVARAGDRTGGLVMGAAVAILSALTRTAGVTLVAALALHWLLERRWKLVGIPALLGALLLGGWLLWSALDRQLRPGASYVGELLSLWSGTDTAPPFLERLPRHFANYVVHLIPTSLAIPAVPGTPIDNVFALLLLGVSGIAGYGVLWKRWRPAGLYLATFAALLAVWLWAIGRFLVPVIPLLLVVLLAGAAQIGGRLRERFRVPAMVALAALLALGGATRSWALMRERMQCERGGIWPATACLTADQQSYFEALRWIERNLPRDAVLVTAKSGALWHYTGRRVVSLSESLAQSEDTFVPWLQVQGARWILLSSLAIEDAQGLAPLVRANCNLLQLDAAFAPLTFLFQTASRLTPEQATTSCAAVETYLEAVRDRAW